MTEELDSEQFPLAVSQAIRAVLHVYREANGLLRELGAVLGGGTPAFVPFVERLVPGARARDIDARTLKSYVASVFVPARTDDVPEGDDDDDDEDDDEDEDDEKPGKKRPLILEVGTGFVLARVILYGDGKDLPKLTVRVVSACGTEQPLPEGSMLKVSRGRFRKVLRVLDNHSNTTGPLKTLVTVPTLDKKKHKLTVMLKGPMRSYPLFDVTPQKLEQIANEIRGA